MMNLKAKARDKCFEDSVITSVNVSDSGKHWNISFDGRCFYCPIKKGILPKVGDSIRFYSRQPGCSLGSVIRGVDIQGKPIFYRTKKEQQAKFAAELLRDQQQKFKKYQITKPKMQKRIDRLPKEFQDRIKYFRSRHATWGQDYEKYELFVCEQAVAIAMHLKTAEAIKEWMELPYAKQKAIIPELTNDHSGNTFGMACRLAHLYWEAPHMIPKMHGAMCAICGCKEYGCYASSAEAKAKVKAKTPDVANLFSQKV